jgi:hypothetical protein
MTTGYAAGAAYAGMGTPKVGDVVTIVTLVVGAGSAPPAALRQQQRAEESTTAAWRGR